jgi:hypothetical protein
MISQSLRRKMRNFWRTKNVLPNNLETKRVSSRLREVTMTFSPKKRRRNGKSSKVSMHFKLLLVNIRSTRLMTNVRIFSKRKVN